MATVPPTRLTRGAGWAVAVMVLLTAVHLAARYDSLPWLLPVHFRADGVPNGWQYKTVGRVFMPVAIQATLALTLGGISALLLARREPPDLDAADVHAARSAAEAVALTSAIWVGVQAYLATALSHMWMTEHGGIGTTHRWVEFLGLIFTVAIGIRARFQLGRPAPLPYVAGHWRWRQLYKNSDNPALFVPTRNGSGWTLNFGRPGAIALMGLVLLVGAIVPSLLLALALR